MQQRTQMHMWKDIITLVAFEDYFKKATQKLCIKDLDLCRDSAKLLTHTQIAETIDKGDFIVAGVDSRGRKCIGVYTDCGPMMVYLHAEFLYGVVTEEYVARYYEGSHFGHGDFNIVRSSNIQQFH